MKHSLPFQWKLKNFTLLFIIGIILASLGFSDNNNSITSFYYYQDKPMYINLRTDKIFIKTLDVMTKDELRTSLSQYSQIASVNKMDVNEKMQFIDLAMPMSASDIDAFVKILNQNPQIEYSSPVFSPFDGKGNDVLQGLIDEILVQFKPVISANQINEYLNRNNFTILQTLDLTGGTSYVLKVPESSGMYSIDAANMVYNSGLVKWAEPNFYYSGLLNYIPNDQFFPMQWSVRNLGNNVPGGITGTPGCDMRVDSAWNITLGVAACVVGMVDTGIDTTHEDIRANLLISKGWDFINNHALQTDDHNHGTCTGGIVGAVGNNTIGVSGIAPNVKLIPVKIFNAGGSTSTTAITNGLLYSWQQGEWISSNSWGGGSPVAAANQAILDGTTLGRGGKGTVFLIASGNGNGAVQWPATLTTVVSVGGNSPCNQRKSTTSCDLENYWGASYGTNLHIVAPCTKVYAPDRMGTVGYSTTNYFATFNGTSSACPNAAGVVALALSLDSNQTWDTLRSRLDRTATKAGAYTYTSIGPIAGLGNTWNNEMGYGIVNAYKLLQLIQQTAGPSISHVPLGNTEQTTSTRAVNCVITPAGSNIDPTKTKLYYGKLPAGFTDSLLMTNTGGNNWTQNITLSGPGTYRYYIKTADLLSRVATAPFGAPGSFYSFVSTPDTIPPVITHTAIGNTPKVNWPVAVTANVTDNLGIDSVWVKWYKNNTSTTKHLKLLLTTGSTYSALFNSLNADVQANDSIFYKVFAQDNGSNRKRDSTALYKFKIIAQTTACIGTGTTSISNYPFNTFWWGNRTQMLWTSAEINANSGAAGLITRIGFQINVAAAQSMGGFMIRMQHTANTTVTGFLQSGWTTYYYGTYTVPGTGWQYIDLQTPFQYNGTQNLLVDICFGNTSYTSATSVYGTAATSMVWYYYADVTTVCTNTGGSAGTTRPNVCFVINTGTGTSENKTVIPNKYSLSQNYPNPFNPVTQIKYDLPKQGLVMLKVYDVLGREVSNLVNEVKAPGSYIVDFDGTSLSSGVYFYKLEVNGFADIKRMVLIK